MSYIPKVSPNSERPEPPRATPSIKKECDHKYTHLETKREQDINVTGYQIGWRRIDRFFCEKCLKYKDKVREEWSRSEPDWY